MGATDWRPGEENNCITKAADRFIIIYMKRFFVTNFLLLFDPLSCKVLLFVHPTLGDVTTEIP
jgi:hypothetical protein